MNTSKQSGANHIDQTTMIKAKLNCPQSINHWCPHKFREFITSDKVHLWIISLIPKNDGFRLR